MQLAVEERGDVRIVRVKEAKLTVALWDGHPPFPGVMHAFEQPSRLSSRTFHFELSRSGNGVWVENHRDDPEYSAEDFAALLFKCLMERGAAKRRK